MRRDPKGRRLSDQQLVDAVEAVSFGRRWSELTTSERERRDQLLAELGRDVVDLAQARCRLKLAEAQRRARGDDA